MWTSPDGDIVWIRIRVIQLEKQLPVKASSIYPTPVGFFPGVFFFNTDDGVFSINLMSDQVKKELENNKICVIKVVPYMSFYTPGIYNFARNLSIWTVPMILCVVSEFMKDRYTCQTLLLLPTPFILVTDHP